MPANYLDKPDLPVCHGNQPTRIDDIQRTKHEALRQEKYALARQYTDQDTDNTPQPL